MEFEVLSLGDLPLFNLDACDDKDESKDPESVQTLRNKIREADAVIFACAEFNYSISGVLKNAIDWGSRSANGNAFDGKPAMLLSAGGGAGGGRAQYHLRQIAVFLNLHVMNKPELQIKAFEPKDGGSVFDYGDGSLRNEEIKQRVDTQLEAFRVYTLQKQLGAAAFTLFHA